MLIISGLTLILLVLSLALRHRGVMRYFSFGKEIKVSDSKGSEEIAEEPKISEKRDAENEPLDRCEGETTVLSDTMSIDVERADSLITDSLAKSLLRKNEDVVITNGKRKEIINVDTLSKNFAPYEKIDVNRLKEMSLIPYDTAYIKVLARGMIDKPLRVYANDFSLSAIKMIALTGGESIRVNTVQKKNARR